MNIETEKLLGTLEVLVINPFFWESEKLGNFNVWNLMISEGFVNLTDVDLAIAHWQDVESWGTPTNQVEDEYKYAPLRSERDDLWNVEIAKFRVGCYQQLLKTLKANLSNLQAFRLSIYREKNDDFEWTHPNFCFHILIGKTTDGDWFCFSPTVPNQVSDVAAARLRQRRRQPLNIESTEANPSNPNTLLLQSQIDSILSQLPPITLYGYYYGGYNETYEHQIVYSTADSKVLAVENVLQAAKMLKVENTNIEFTSNEYNRKLSQFFNTKLCEPKIYTLSFWDIGYTYQVGETSTGDFLGVRKMLEFEYNP